MSKRNLILKILLVAVAFFYAVTMTVSGELIARIGSVIFSFIVPFAGDILRLFKIKLPEHFEFAYLIFLFFAMYLGIDFNFYKFVPHYDKVIHAVSGVLSFVLGLMIADACDLKARKFIDARIIFALLISISIAFLWECVEFAADGLFEMSMQTLISEGPADTMLDMIWATLGASFCAVIEWFKTKQTRRKTPS